jgi:hypothetical protein
MMSAWNHLVKPKAGDCIMLLRNLDPKKWIAECNKIHS